jgi:hypothetical protein
VIGVQQLRQNVSIASKAGWKICQSADRTEVYFNTQAGGPSMDLFGISRQPRFMAVAA